MLYGTQPPEGSMHTGLEDYARHIPKLADLLWAQRLTAAHNTQHRLALNLALSFACGSGLRLLTVGSGGEELSHDLEAWIGAGGVAREDRCEDENEFHDALPP